MAEYYHFGDPPEYWKRDDSDKFISRYQVKDELNTLATENAELTRRVAELEEALRDSEAQANVFHRKMRDAQRAYEKAMLDGSDYENVTAPAAESEAAQPLDSDPVVCGACSGSGEVDYLVQETQEYDYTICPRCKGEGEYYPPTTESEVVKPLNSEAIEWIKILNIIDFEKQYQGKTFAVASHDDNRICCYRCGYDDMKFALINDYVLCEDCTLQEHNGLIDWSGDHDA